MPFRIATEPPGGSYCVGEVISAYLFYSAENGPPNISAGGKAKWELRKQGHREVVEHESREEGLLQWQWLNIRLSEPGTYRISAEIRSNQGWSVASREFIVNETNSFCIMPGVFRNFSSPKERKDALDRFIALSEDLREWAPDSFTEENEEELRRFRSRRASIVEKVPEVTEPGCRF